MPTKMDFLSQTLSNSKPLNAVSNLNSKDFKKKYLNKKQPVVLKNHASGWEAVKNWNIDFFTKLESNKTVDLEVGNVIQNEAIFLRQSFKDYISKLHEGELNKSKSKTYLSMFNVFEHFPDLKRDTDFSIFSNYMKKSMTYAWIGPKNTITGFHADSVNNMLAQIMGKKLVILSSTMSNKKMYPSKKFDLGAVLSEVDLNNYDEKKHPEFKKVEFYSATLEPGDVLYIPKGWWHYVRSLDTSISVNNFGYTKKETLLLKPVEVIKNSLHHRGYYKKNNCTCHKIVDGKWVSK